MEGGVRSDLLSREMGWWSWQVMGRRSGRRHRRLIERTLTHCKGLRKSAYYFHSKQQHLMQGKVQINQISFRTVSWWQTTQNIQGGQKPRYERRAPYRSCSVDGREVASLRGRKQGKLTESIGKTMTGCVPKGGVDRQLERDYLAGGGQPDEKASAPKGGCAAMLSMHAND